MGVTRRNSKQLERSYATMANWALVLAILSWIILGIILAPASLVLATKASKSQEPATRATAIIAAIIGGVATAVMAMLLVGLVAAAGTLR